MVSTCDPLRERIQMEKINARRGFLKGFSLLGAAVGGFVATQNAFANTPSPTPIGSSANVERDIGPVEDIAHLAPLGKTTLVLTADNLPPPPPPPPPPHIPGTITFSPINSGNKETDNRVTLSVGKDNRLWIKIGDQWRRVALDG